MASRATREIIGVLVVCLVLAAVVAAGIWMAPLVGQPVAKPVDPGVDRAASGAERGNPRSGRIVLGAETNCRRMAFDNETGAMRHEGGGCSDAAPSGGLTNFKWMQDGFKGR
jgi:hypothetical protein